VVALLGSPNSHTPQTAKPRETFVPPGLRFLGGRSPPSFLPQSSRSRMTAGAAGFLTMIQLSVRPETCAEPTRLLTMPSIPVAVNVLAQAHPDAGIGTRLRVASLNRHGPQSSPSSFLASRTSATHLRMFTSVLLAKDSLIPSPPKAKVWSYEKTWRCSTNGSSNTALREHALLPSRIACSSLPFAP
jgi:hypothetical protein